MSDRTERIAIVGVGGIFPGAPDLETFWRNVSNGIDSGRHVPSERWFLSQQKAFDPNGIQVDRVYSTWGCFIEDFHFDPAGLKLDLELVRRLDPLFHLGLHAARAAFYDARQLSETDLNRVGVILGNIALPTESTSAMCRDVLGRTLIEKMIHSTPLSASRHEVLKSRILRETSTTDWHPLNRFAASLPAALIAKGLSLGGSAYTLDAACASSLYALKFACEELRTHRADAMLAGGMSRPDCQYTQMGFAQLKALSRRGRCAPLSSAADGLVVGEGAGVFVLKRLSDAVAAGDQIYGVIAGIGLSNDRGANLLAPHSEGQLRAMKSAYEEARWRPSDVDLIECHATGTPVGDSVEIASLHQLWQNESSRPGQCVIGGVKSNVGHLLTGAGAAGLMKVLLAFKHQTLPATANYESPAAALDQTGSPFRVLAKSEPWPARSENASSNATSSWRSTSRTIPRRATVNAFGFGGINAHVLMEEYLEEPHSQPTAEGSRQTVILPDRGSENLASPFPVPIESSLDIAIIGLAVHLGDFTSQAENETRNVADSRQEVSTKEQSNDWGVSQSNWYQQEFGSRRDSQLCHVGSIKELRLPLGEFRIPPLEMQDMLPQQQLMLQVASYALKDSEDRRQTGPALPNGMVDQDSVAPKARGELGNRTGVFVGIELDPNTTNFHLRWSVEEQASRWAELLGLQLSSSELSEWTERLKDSASLGLTANRVMGNLGGIVASRLAREFNVGGPSFTISSDENSGLRACELAANALRRGELDQALVGAVDLPCDIRSQVAFLRSEGQEVACPKKGSDPLRASDFKGFTTPSKGSDPFFGQSPPQYDGAAAIVLKRLEDAIRDGDRIHSVICRVTAGIPDLTIPSPPFSGTDVQRREENFEEKTAAHWKSGEPGCVSTRISSTNSPGANASRLTDLNGNGGFQYQEVKSINASTVGAATGLISLAQSVASLRDRILDEPIRHHWLRNRKDGILRVCVPGYGVDGRNLAVELSESPSIAERQNEVIPRKPVNCGSFSQESSNAQLPANLFVIDGDSLEQIDSALQQLSGHVDLAKSADQLARVWFRERPPNSERRFAVTLIVKALAELPDVLRLALARIRNGSTSNDRDRRVYFSHQPLGRTGRLAFVFPGSGNAFLGMGRDLLATFPEVLWRQDSENERLRDQYRPDLIWHAKSTAELLEDHKAMIFSQVALGTAICDLLAMFNVRPSASIGYSLGESAALFGLRVWTDRDEMLQRMDDATLFGSDLVRPFNAARKAWNFPADVEIDWISGVIDKPAEQVKAAIPNLPFQSLSSPSRLHPDKRRVYLLIVNSPSQCVIGGDRDEVMNLARELAATFVPFLAPSTVHCEVLRQVEPAYRALHLMRTTKPTAPRQIDFYSTAWGRAYDINRESAADAIVAQAIDTIDFPKVIERAYADGVRLFVEVGPGSSCTRMIDEILSDREHVSQTATPATANSIIAFLELLAMLLAERVPVDLTYLYGDSRLCPKKGSDPWGKGSDPFFGQSRSSSDSDLKSSASSSRQEVVTRIGGAPFEIPVPPGGWNFVTNDEIPIITKITIDSNRFQTSDAHGQGDSVFHNVCQVESGGRGSPTSEAPEFPEIPSGGFLETRSAPATQHCAVSKTEWPYTHGTNAMSQLDDMLAARLKAHETYLRVSAEAQRMMAEQLALLRLCPKKGSEPLRASDFEGLTTPSKGSDPVFEQSSLLANLPNSRTGLGEEISISAAPVTRPLETPNGSAAPGWNVRQDAENGPAHGSVSLLDEYRDATTPSIAIPDSPPRSLSRPQCMEFAIGQIGKVLGRTFAEIDRHPTRVRLPDEPLMLVDRILEIEGEPLSMTSGRVVTEHDIQSNAWYLDCNRIPTCIAVEAGQADLFLSAWLGIDFETKGVACYRLLDAVVTFHRELPQPGKTIHYDIRINHFFRQGKTYLFRFEFDATVDGHPLLTMREGCAGFFTEAELAGGKGIVHTALDRQPRPGKRTSDWIDLVPMTIESYNDSQLLALRHGNLEACFGNQFSGLPLVDPMTIPGIISPLAPALRGEGPGVRGFSSSSSQLSTGLLKHEKTRMWLIDRVLKLDPTGGKFGMGTILGELDIHPDDWFLTCHFCDDQVMPGTLMYECCLHTLRIFLLRMGWVGESGKIVYEPIPGIRSRLKCRGQVRANTKKVWYEITLKEIGYSGSETETAGQVSAAMDDSRYSIGSPYCLADALMYADGKPIVEITDMSVRLTGLTRQVVEGLWNSRSKVGNDSLTHHHASRFADISSRPQSSNRPIQYDRRPALFDTDRITAFAIGKPSDAFGDCYRIFDSERVIARLPGPPFQFLDRIVEISGCQPWVLQPGGQVVAQYDVPPDAWYFEANRQRRMPFAVLLETALQPCGWLAGYVGSALTSDTDLSFRNLGGTATQYIDVTPESGTLTTTVKMTRVSNSGGMIIQHYDFDLRCNGQPVYVGNTYFGFFSRASLANQVGIRDAKPFAPSPTESARANRFRYIDARPFADSRFQMIDNVELSLEHGPTGHGYVIGTTTVDPTSWFFKAHFHQDPVVPGSLGLESFFQLLKVYAVHRWHLEQDAEFTTPIIQGQSPPIEAKHEWVYRGQVIPRDKLVTVSAVINHVDDTRRELSADGFLSVDGRIIYQMKKFSLGLG